MLYKTQTSVAKSTTALAPDIKTLKITKGVIIEWIIFFPQEAANLCQFQVTYHGHNLLPVNPDEWIYGFFNPIRIQESVKIDDPPYELKIKAINADDKHAHEYNIHVNVMPPKPVTPGVVDTSIIDRFRNLFGGG